MKNGAGFFAFCCSIIMLVGGILIFGRNSLAIYLTTLAVLAIWLIVIIGNITKECDKERDEEKYEKK